MAILSKHEFEHSPNIMDEACRQWYAFIEEDSSRADGEGFSSFYEQLCAEKYEEYRNHPDEFDFDAPVSAKESLLLLNAEQADVLNHIISTAVQENDLDNDEKAILTDIQTRLQFNISEDEGMVM